MGFQWNIPSGMLCNIAIENGHRNSYFSIGHCDFPYLCKRLPEGMFHKNQERFVNVLGFHFTQKLWAAGFQDIPSDKKPSIR